MIQADSYARQIAGLGNDDLLRLLGEQARQAAKNAEIAGTLIAMPPQEMGLRDEAKELGLRILRRLARELHDVICGDGEGAQKDRKTILSVLGKGGDRDAVIAAVAGLLVSSFGTMPAIAAIAATFLVRRLAEPTREEICKYWGEQLNA